LTCEDQLTFELIPKSPDPGLARRTDPATSKLAAAMVGSNKTPSRTAVWDIMCDGLARTDEMIEAEAEERRCPLSPTRLRHGRRELIESGALVTSPIRWATRRGRMSRVYVRADRLDKFLAAVSCQKPSPSNPALK
jgi:hypothetical protein